MYVAAIRVRPCNHHKLAIVNYYAVPVEKITFKGGSLKS